jgi:RNA polymerase sigma factor (TIGR02999 family)
LIALRHLASESPGHLLQPTALVHEVFLRLINQDHVDWRGKSHFLAISARMMRRVLVDEARAKHRVKRGGGKTCISLSEDLTLSPRDNVDVLAVDEALATLEELDPQQAKIVELRFFGGMSVEEVAEVLGQSKRTVERQWTAIRAWLRRELAEEDAV